MPAGATTTLGELARAAGFADGGALLAAERSGDVPRLPTHQRMFGQAIMDSGLARCWLRDLQQYKLTEPERLALRNAEAKERFEATMRDRQAERDAEAQRLREQRAHFRACEEDHAERDRAEAALQAGRVAIVLDAAGRRIE
jgi:hypothetical protein